MLPTSAQWKSWSLPAKYSAVGLLISILSILAFNIPALLAPDNESKKLKSLVFRSAHELRNSREYLHGLALAVRDRQAKIPIGKVNTDALLQLFSEHHARVMSRTHGEEKYMYQLVLGLRNAASQLGTPRSHSDLESFNKNYEMTIDDLLFLASFINWYLAEPIDKELTPDERYSLGWGGVPGRKFSPEGIKKLDMRYFVENGKPITEFTDYLGLID